MTKERIGFGRVTVHSRRTYCGPKGHYIGRPSVLGNPYSIGMHGDRDEVIVRYRIWLQDRMELRDDKAVLDRMDELADLVRCGQHVHLLCWCAPLPCHGDVVAEFVRRLAEAEDSFPVTDDCLDAPDGARIYDRERLGWYERVGNRWERRDGRA